jgi:hypothetical protein
MASTSGAIGEKEFESFTSEFTVDMRDFFELMQEDIIEVFEQGIKDGLSLPDIQTNINNLFVEDGDEATDIL